MILILVDLSFVSGSRPGRKSKGRRKAHTIRFPEELYADLQKDAAAAGYTHFGDFIVDVVAAMRDTKHWPRPDHQQERLKLSA
ncbi:hypothetical protein [Sphaerimonospora mesophila]|uniref:hypothetical protein n=1 Tax=Sphaerimonospora mesophila TaxID=37483 RepID=UPI000A82F751